MELAIMEYKAKYEQAQREIAQLQTVNNRDSSFRKSSYMAFAVPSSDDQQILRLTEEKLSESNKLVERLRSENLDLKSQIEKNHLKASVSSERRTDNTSNKIFELESELAMMKIEVIMTISC